LLLGGHYEGSIILKVERGIKVASSPEGGEGIKLFCKWGKGKRPL
jgi:hypothetical protein